MADGYFPTLISKDNNANSQTNPVFTAVTDGTDLALVTAAGELTVLVNNGAGGAAVNIQDGGNSITIDGTVAISSVVPGTGATNLGKAEDAAHTSGDVGVMALAVRNDAATALAADGDYSVLQVDSTGALRVSASVTVASDHVDDAVFTPAVDYVSTIGGFADETATDSVNEGDTGALRMTLDRKLLTRIVGATDANRLDVDASGNAQVDIAAISVTAVPVSKDSSANSETNPIWVQVTDTQVSGEETHDYSTASAVASGATSNHNYTVAGTTFFLKSIIFSASGPGKVEVQTGPVASLVSKAVAFIPPFGENVQLNFNPPIEVPSTSTGTVRLIRTNRAALAQDLYSTIIGLDV